MTTDEAIADLVAYDPTLTYSVTEQFWYYPIQNSSILPQNKKSFTITLFLAMPNGMYQVYGDDLPLLIQKIKDHIDFNLASKTN